jgi:hypothetical protein
MTPFGRAVVLTVTSFGTPPELEHPPCEANVTKTASEINVITRIFRAEIPLEGLNVMTFTPFVRKVCEKGAETCFIKAILLVY